MEDNSVLLEDSNMEETLSANPPLPPRKSISQPTLLPNDEAELTNSAQKQGLSNNFPASNVRSIPIIETWRQNEELKGQMYTLRTQVQMFERKYLEAKEASHKSVQEVMDEYVLLKIAQDDMEEKARQFADLENEIRALKEKNSLEKEHFFRLSAQFEQQKQVMEMRIRELEQVTSTVDGNNTTFGSLRGTLDDIMKKNDPDYTLTGYEDKKINDLENRLLNEMDKVSELEDLARELRKELDDQSARLADSENHRAQLEAAAGQGILGAAGASSTFVIGNARESQTAEQIRYIDELETKLTAANNDSEKARLALVEYMNRCSKLENDIYTMRKNTTFDTSSMLIEGKTSEELKAQIDKVNGELNSLRAENRELRIRCDQLTGGEGNLSTSLGQSRLMAGISATELASRAENETGGTSMQILRRDSHSDENFSDSHIQDSKLPLMDTTAALKNQEEFDAAWQEFEAEKNRLKFMTNDTADCSDFDMSMPPPGANATQSFLIQKGFKNSPVALSVKKTQQSGEQIQNNSFSTKDNTSLVGSAAAVGPTLLQDVQQILDSSQVLLDGQHDAAVNVERMQEKMSQIREALARLFERLKSSAALFEDILEKMGSSSPLADRIKQMKLAFETSMCDHADVSVFLEAAEKDLTNMSLNFSVLEKSIVGQSFVADVSRRFTIAPGADEIASSSLLNASSYSPIFKFQGTGRLAEIEKLQKEVADLKNELELARVRELRSPLQASPGRLYDVQIKAAQNFEELEVCQATLRKAEAEKAVLAQELAELETAHRHLTAQLSDVREELHRASESVEAERNHREKAETALFESEQMVQVLQSGTDEKYKEIMLDVERRHAEVREHHKTIIEGLQAELKTSLDEENSIRDYLEEIKVENGRLRQRTHEAELTIEKQASEKQTLVTQLVALENKLEHLEVFEQKATNYGKKLEEKKVELAEAKYRFEVEKESISGLERIQKQMAELTKKNAKAQIVLGEASSIRSVCDEICRRISQECNRQHEYAQTLSAVNDKIEQLTIEKENASPSPSPYQISVKTPSSSSAPKPPSSSKFLCPTRQLLHEATLAVDAIVQRLKKTHTMPGMGSELKETVVKLLTDSRALRDFLHQNLNLFKGIDVNNWKNETVEQLLERLEQCYQDNLILEEENRKFKKELKQMKAAIPNLGADVQERIKREIGGIAKDMGAVKALRKK
uniref:Uncharacterized protein n=2 Tax=Caenorhabditis japonica TaxID=281687 RepID=A0A8R1DGC5_CAEJA